MKLESPNGVSKVSGVRPQTVHDPRSTVLLLSLLSQVVSLSLSNTHTARLKSLLACSIR
jgi:hypothetical protein